MKHKVTDLTDDDVVPSTPRRRPKGLMRAARYHILRILRIRATPHSIALGTAAGVAAAFFPIVGVHIAISVALAWILGGNMIAAAAGTVLAGNPVTYPFIWAATWEAGQLILGHGPRAVTRFNLHELFHKMDFAMLWRPILKPMLVGSVPLAIAGAFVGYVVMYQVVKIFRARRQARLEAR